MKNPFISTNRCVACGREISPDARKSICRICRSEGVKRCDVEDHPASASSVFATGCSGAARYGAALIDHVVGGFLMFAVGSVLRDLIGRGQGSLIDVAWGFFVGCVYFLYFLVGEILFGTSVGKLFTGLVVRRTDGSPSTVRTSLLRTLTRLLEVNPLALGGLPAAIIVRFSTHRQRWGDMLAGTVVVERHLVQKTSAKPTQDSATST